MRSTQAKLGASVVIRDPVCGMTVDPNAEKPTAEHAAHMYHFCSQGCRTKFVASPESFLTATDPVCGMNVERASAQHFLRHESKGFYFCSAGCKAKFEAEPTKYLGDRPALEPMPKGTQYTCPMHPEIVRDKPGSCPDLRDGPGAHGRADRGRRPKSGTDRFHAQALGKRSFVHPASVAHDGVDGGRAFPRLARRPDGSVDRVGAGHPGRALGCDPLFPSWLGVDRQPQPQYVDADLDRCWRSLCLQRRRDAVSGHLPAPVPRTWRCGAGLFRSSRRHRCAGLPRPGVWNSRRGSAQAPQSALCSTSRQRQRGGSPQDGSEADVPLDDVKAGERLRVRPGDSVPVDGVVLEGRTSIDESMITGEPVPVEKTEGDTVTGGTLNKNGTLVIRAERVGAETMLSRIVEMVAKAQRSRAPIQGLADRVSFYFVPTVVLIAILAFIVWAVFGPDAEHGLRDRLGGLGPDNRLSLCAGACHANVDHDGYRTRRTGWRPHQGCRGAGALRQSRYADRRQDRHANRGKAQAHRCHCSRRLRRQRPAVACGQP